MMVTAQARHFGLDGAFDGAVESVSGVLGCWPLSADALGFCRSLIARLED